MMTFLLFAPASTKWLGWRKTQKIPRGPLTIGRFCDINCASYFDTLLRYVLSVTFRGAGVIKVMGQKTLVKRRWSCKVRIAVYILTPSEFARQEVTNLWLETLPDTLPLSLTGIRLGPKQPRRVNDSTASLYITSRTMNDYRNSPTIKFCADLFPAHKADVLPL